MGTNLIIEPFLIMGYLYWIILLVKTKLEYFKILLTGQNLT